MQLGGERRRGFRHAVACAVTRAGGAAMIAIGLALLGGRAMGQATLAITVRPRRVSD